MTHPAPLKSLLAAFVAAIGADVLLWAPKTAPFPALGATAFALLLAALVLWVRPAPDRGRIPPWLLILFAGALVEGTIDFCFTNFCVLFALLLALAGQTFFSGVEGVWRQRLAQFGALFTAPFRPWTALGDVDIGSAPGGMPGLVRGGFRGIAILAPAVLLAVLFAIFLGRGNALLAWWMKQIGSSFLDSIGRIFAGLSLELTCFLAFFGSAALTLCAPSRNRGGMRFWWKWTERLDRFGTPRDEAPAHWRGLAILAALNLLFFAANGIDAFYLWTRGAPPQVSMAKFVHEGTGDLVFTTLLAGITLAFLFNQAPSLTARRCLRSLALLWIAQNLFLLSSVALRLKLYIDDYALSEERLSLLAFLVLNAAGFVLLAVKIVREKSMAWLLGAGGTAVFFLFYAVQFIDFGGIAAAYNVARWERNPALGQPLDIGYLERTGPGGWGPLSRVADQTGDPALADTAQRSLAVMRAANRKDGSKLDWRGWQAREEWNRHFLEEIPPLSPSPEQP